MEALRPLACRAAALAGCALAALAAGGCGGDDEEDVRAAFVDLRFAYFAGDYGAVCTGMTAPARRELADMGHGPGGACPHDMAERLSSAAPSRRDRLPAEIAGVVVDDDRATVTVDLGGRSASAIAFAKVDGRWKLDELFGTTGPAPLDMQ